MKLLHSADWHLGKALRAQSRREEYEAVLNELLDIARREAVDCLLVAGDVFDSTTPPPEAEELLFGFLRELFGAGIPAVIIGGNHDHPRRLAAVAKVLEVLNVHMRPDAVVPESGGLVRVPSRDGSEAATVAVLPWVHERDVIRWQSLLGHESHQEYAEEVARMAAHLAGAAPTDTVNVLLSHMMVDKALVGGGERELHLGAVYAVKPAALPASLNYIALGHLHRPQEIDAPSPARYAGSLLQLDFGETKDDKSVVLIEAHAGRPAKLEVVPLTSGRRLRDLSGTLAELQTQAADAGDDYLRVRVLLDGPLPGLTRQVREFLPNALEVVPVYDAREERSDAAERLRTLSPDQLLADYHQTTYGSALPAPVLALFRELQEEMERAAP
jgi:exonuclease SbcD